MNTVACYKVVPDGQDIGTKPDGTLDFSRAKRVLGEYDLMALEEAAHVADATDGKAVLLSAGDAACFDTKLVKAALSRGASELFCVVDDQLSNADAFQTASVLAGALKKMDADLVICGEGSSDLYAQQVGLILGSLLGYTTVNGVNKIEPGEGCITVERVLENEVQTLEVALPAVVSVTTDINLPRIPQLKDILAAGKKPVTKWTLDEVGGLPEAKVEIVSTLAPESVERKGAVYGDASDDNIAQLAVDIKTAL